uniref:uncharacterized protein LOC120331185 isoform X1 n=1 Tax=Styela clava TaxID=7725 RepID=UPI00193A9B1A|nr:uncharacterized protein LOC120331185 isoform X1 [Styela clava]
MEPSRIVEKPESGASESHQEAGVSPVNQKTEVQMASKVGRAKQSIEGGEASSKAQPFHSDPDESERASAPGGAKSSQIKEKSESNVAGESDSPQKVGASSVDHKTKVQMVTKVGRAERSVEGGETPTKAQPFDTDSNESRGASAPDGATKQSIEREASSKAQPFHSDPDESERASSLGGATERSVEGGVRPSKDQTFDTDSNESLGASAPDGASDIRIEDAFAEIARKFTSFIHFKMFALSGNGLRLSAGEVSTIIADNPDSVEDKKFGMLDLWKEKNGTRASPTHIAEIIQQYFRQERGGVTGSRIEDAFLAVPKVFDNAALFQRFALSGKGLSLSMHEVGNIKENAKNVEERNLDLLVLWKLKTGDSATTEKIWQLANAFLDERGESHPDQPPLHPRPMELPVAEERAGDAEPLRPDAEPSQADPRPVRQEPAERVAEEGEASSKAQPFHSDEFEGASALGGASQSSSEVQAPSNVLGSQGAGKTVPDQSPLHPRPMEPPVDEERAGDAEPLRPDVQPLRPDAEPLRPNAEPLRPDVEPSQADPRPVNQEPAERFAEEGEASSKAQPFHSDESEGALAPGGAIQISSEVSDVLGSQGAGKPVSDQSPLHPRPMEPPVDEERAGDAEPLRPDVEPSQADPRPVNQEPAERFAEEGEASSKAQPFHFDESEGALAPGGAIQISSEVSAVLGSQGAGKPVSVSFPKGKFDRAHFGDQHIATQNITNYYGPVVNQDSAQQKRKDAPGVIKAAVGLGENDGMFKLIIC